MRMTPNVVKAVANAVRKYGVTAVEPIPVGKLHMFEAADLTVLFIEKAGKVAFHSITFSLFGQVFNILNDMTLVATAADDSDEDALKRELTDAQSVALIEEWLTWRIKFLTVTGV